MLRRIFYSKMNAVTQTWKNFHTEKKVIIFYSLPNVITVVIKGGLKMSGTGNVKLRINVCRIFIENL
jgi:hypothetical protein